MKKTIGILGGIGPEATADLYSSIILKLQEKGIIKDNAGYPHIIINSIPPSEIFLEKDLKEYIKGVKDLEKFGSDFIAVACNTANIYFKEFQKAVKVPIISLKEEVKKYLDKNNIQTLVVLGTGETIEKGLYYFKDKKYVSLTNDEVKGLNKAIFNFNRGVDKEKSRGVVIDIAKKYYKNGTILSACTEISLMLKGSWIKSIDTMDMLGDSIINYWVK